MTSKEGWSVTLEHFIEAASLAEANDMPTFSTDEYIHVQVDGGHWEPSPPVIVMPTHLHQWIKATRKDTGLVWDASLHCSQLLTLATPPPTSAEMNIDDDPFLSELLMQPLKVFNNQQPSRYLPGAPILLPTRLCQCCPLCARMDADKLICFNAQGQD